MSSIRSCYEELGVDGYYKSHADAYVNPHSAGVVWLLRSMNVDDITTGLDFGCGDGLVTKTLTSVAFTGFDPYMGSRYEHETGRPCIRASASDLASGQVELPSVDLIVCSYVIDILPESLLPNLLWQFSRIGKKLVTLRPNRHRLDSPHWSLESIRKIDKTVLAMHNLIYTAPVTCDNNFPS